MFGTSDQSRGYRAAFAIVLYIFAIAIAISMRHYSEVYPTYDTTLDSISIFGSVILASALFGYNVGTRHLRPCGECEYRNVEPPHTLCLECVQVADEYYYYEPEATSKRRFFNK